MSVFLPAEGIGLGVIDALRAGVGLSRLWRYRVRKATLPCKPRLKTTRRANRLRDFSTTLSIPI
jgi:hypothetical protein